MRNQILALSSLLFSALLITGGGCTTTTPTTTTTTTNTNTNTTTVPVDVDDTDPGVDADDVTANTGETSITIVSPRDGESTESIFDVSVDISNFTLAPDKVESANVEGEGHYHVLVDGEYYAAGVTDATTVEGLAPGTHEIQVSLQNNDHTDLATVVTSAPITVMVVK